MSFLPPLFPHSFRNLDAVVTERMSDLSRTSLFSSFEDIDAETLLVFCRSVQWGKKIFKKKKTTTPPKQKQKKKKHQENKSV